MGDGGDDTLTEDGWAALAARCSRSVQTTIGWIFWDPGAIARYERLGLPAPVGYIAARCAPLAPAGPDAVIAAFGSISPFGIRMTFELVAQRTTFEAVWAARDEAVREGLQRYAPDIVGPLERIGPELWPVVDALPSVGRVCFAAHLRMPRPEDPLLSGWHAVNAVREWRGDTHWAIVAAEGLTGVEASVLHDAWLGYEPGWLPRSRGSSAEEIDGARASLTSRGLMDGDRPTEAGLALRQRIEDRTNELGAWPWRMLGAERAVRLAEELEPPCRALLARVDETAGVNYQPASRSLPGRAAHEQP